MGAIALLGDSVIDNASYVLAGEPDVPAQIRDALPGWQVEMRAVDGFVCGDVLDALRKRSLPEGLPVFLSAGGNDALRSIGLLSEPARITFGEAMVKLLAVREAFRASYAALLDALGARPVLVATIYNPNFTAEEAQMQLQEPARAALSAFNDVIQQEALARGHDVLDLRGLFIEAAHYANPIEPSAAGGARLAAAVAGWAKA